MRRAERLAQVLPLREQGLTYAEIGKRLGITRSYVEDLVKDPKGIKMLERARRHRMTSKHPCARCGKPCTSRATRCQACEREILKVWTREAIIEAIRFFVASEGRLPAATDWNRSIQHRSRRSTPAVYEGYPSLGVVQKEFGSWNKAIEAAGFTPRKAGTYEWKRQHGGAQATWPIKTGITLITEEGWTVREVAELYDVPPNRIYSVLTNRGIRVSEL